MSYITAQGLLKTLLLTLSSLIDGSVTEGDLRVLDKGYSTMAVIYPGALPEYDLAGMTREHEYEAIVDLFVRVVDGDEINDLGTLRDAVITALEAAPCLSATYFVTALSSDRPEEIYDTAGGGPAYFVQRCYLTIQEQV